MDTMCDTERGSVVGFAVLGFIICWKLVLIRPVPYFPMDFHVMHEPRFCLHKLQQLVESQQDVQRVEEMC